MKKWGYLLGLLILLEILSTALYLTKAGHFGFPLDDAWIHQTYARNLGLHGVMAFSPDHPSSGSTSFGWTVLLAAGYWLKVPFFFWTYLWGNIFAIATAFVAAHLSQSYFGDFRKALIVGVLCILEWHLAWAAVSGMEIGLFTFLTLIFLLLLNRNSSPLLLGTLAGIILMVRPEGTILALIYAFKLVLTQPHNIKNILLNAVIFLIMLLIVSSPWVLFNLTYSHKPFPNTISAKFMVYGYPWSLWKSLKYLWDAFIYFLNGPLMLLVPSSGFAVYSEVRKKNTSHFYAFAWSYTLILLYAVALPAIYDQGRYLMPLIPLMTIYGIEGLDQFLKRFAHGSLTRSTVWLSLISMVFLLWINGASDFAYRTQLYDKVHVQAAQWINNNVPKDAVIATHDIGIIGYYTERQIVDLAGLVTPDVVPIMNNPQKMACYVRAKQVTHLIVYSGYYRDLLTLLHAHLVFSPAAEQLRAMGVEPFEVYEIGKQ
jgi:arabinofuranosyltransferase